MPNRIEARSAKAALTHATGRLPLLRLFSTPLIEPPARPKNNHSRNRQRQTRRNQPQQSWRFLTLPHRAPFDAYFLRNEAA
jgi:hypothetical protein